jgi:Fic family protein
LKDPELLLRPLRNQEAISSSSIEGTTVTAAELLLFEMNPSESGKRGDRLMDWIEVHNYNQAMTQGCDLLKTLPISSRLMKEMHKTLMRGARGKNKTPGDFRKHQVQIGHSGRYVPPSPGEIDSLMGNLDTYVNRPSDNLDPLIRAFVAHYQFEAIHPFLDGNGRIGRALLALMIYNWLGHSKPWLYMSAFYEKFRDEYVDTLYKTSATNAWTQWIEFCLRGTIQQATDSIQRCGEFIRLRREFHERVDRVASPTPRTHGIIEGLFVSPILRLSHISDKFNVTYPTAKADADLLIKAGILQELAGYKPKTVYSPELFRVAYNETVEEVKTA